MGTETEPAQPPDPQVQNPPKPEIGIWFAGACVAVVGLIFFGIQSRRQRQSKPADYEFGGQRAGVVNVPTGGNASRAVVTIRDTALTPSETMPLKRPETFGR